MNKIFSKKNRPFLLIVLAALAVFMLTVQAHRGYASVSTSGTQTLNSTSVLSGISHCSDGSANCGTYYTVRTQLACNWNGGEGSCSTSQSNPGYTPAEPSTFTTPVLIGGSSGVCNATNQPITYSGSIFGATIPANGGSVQAGAPSGGLGSMTVTVPGGCAGSGGIANGVYNITGCVAGYTASSDGVCTQIAPCVINSFTCDSSDTLAWTTSNCSSVSISPSIGSGLPTSGSNANTAQGTYSITANNGAVGPSVATCTKALTCSPPNQTVSSGGSASFTASNGSGSGYTWSVSNIPSVSGSPASGNGTNFSSTFTNTGASANSVQVNLTDSASNSASCSVTVNPPVCGGQPSVSNTYGYSHNSQTGNWDNTTGIYAGNYLIINGSNFGPNNAATVSGIPGASVSASVSTQINVSLGSNTGTYTAIVGNGNNTCTNTQTSVTITSDDAVCGSDNGQSLYITPTNLCSNVSPSYASAVTTTGGTNPAWTWSCNSLYGGSNVSCSANKKVDGGWTTWSNPGGFPDGSGGTCSVACGGGTQSRSCTNPSPANGGAGCPGTSSQSCNSQACSVVSASIWASNPSITSGQNTTINWIVSNSTSAVITSSPTIDPNFNSRPVGNTAGASGSTSNLSQTTTYTITAQGPSGPVTDSATVTVNPAGTPGSCGTANGVTFPFGSLNYGSYTQCGSGSPSSTNFPAPGNTANWTCSGQGGAGPSGTCSASQAAAASNPPLQGLDYPAVSPTPDYVNTWPDDTNGNPEIWGNSVKLLGWAVDGVNTPEALISSVKIYIDGNLVSGNVAHSFSRPDVCASYPGRPDCNDVGFIYFWDTTTVSNGTHIIKVTAVDPNGTTSGFYTVTVMNCTVATYRGGGFSDYSTNTGPTGSTLTISPGNKFYAYVDYGAQGLPANANNPITPPASSGFSCAWGPGTNSGWVAGSSGNSMARFDCATNNPGSSGNYTYQTGINSIYDYQNMGRLENDDLTYILFTISHIPGYNCTGKDCDVYSDGVNDSSYSLNDYLTYRNMVNSAATACVATGQNVGTLTVSAAPVGIPGSVTGSNPSCPATGVTLNWTAGAGASYYNIFKNTSNSIPGSAYASTSSTSFTDAVSGGPYYYWVQSVSGGSSSSQVAANTNASGGISANTCGPAAPTGGSTSNTGGCNLVNLSWTDNSNNETGFYIYRDSTSSPIATAPPSSPASATGGTLTYTVNPTPDNNPHTYYVAAFNGNGVSSAVAEAGGSIASNSCTANLTTSNKEITYINGSAVSGASAYVCQGQTNPLSSSALLNGGDSLTFAVNICNNSASSYATATVSTVVDTMSNLQQPTAGWGAQYCLGSSCFSVTPVVTGVSPNQTLTFNINQQIPFGVTALPGVLTYNAVIAPQSSASYGRFQNGATINYGIGQSWPVNTPLILYYSGTQTPVRNEIPPG